MFYLLNGSVLLAQENAIVHNIDTIHIGQQVWMSKNLNVSVFRNGDTIPMAASLADWIKAYENRTPAWAYYNNDPALGAKFGKIYNWYAVIDERGLAPAGFRIPTRADFEELEKLAFEVAPTWASGHLAPVLVFTDEENWGWRTGTNKLRFNALPGGFRFGSIDRLLGITVWRPDCVDHFTSLGTNTAFWSSTPDAFNENFIIVFRMNIPHTNRLIDNTHISDGLYVRAIME